MSTYYGALLYITFTLWCVCVCAVTPANLKLKRVACIQCFPIGPACEMSVPSHFLEDVTVSGNYQHFPYGSVNSPQKTFSPWLTIFLFQSSEKPIYLLMELPRCLHSKPTQLLKRSFAFSFNCMISFVTE